MQRESRKREAVGVQHPDPDAGVVACHGDQTTFDSERADAGQQIPAVLAVRHQRAVDADLQEQVLDVRVVVGGRGDDRDLAGQGVASRDSVDLSRIWRAHQPQEQRGACRGVVRQLVAEEVGALGRTTSHDHASNAHRVVVVGIHGMQQHRLRLPRHAVTA